MSNVQSPNPNVECPIPNVDSNAVTGLIRDPFFLHIGRSTLTRTHTEAEASLIESVNTYNFVVSHSHTSW